MPSAARASASLMPILSGATPAKLTVFAAAVDVELVVAACALSPVAGVVTFASAFTPAALTALVVADVAVSAAAESTRARDFAVHPVTSRTASGTARRESAHDEKFMRP